MGCCPSHGTISVQQEWSLGMLLIPWDNVGATGMAPWDITHPMGHDLCEDIDPMG
jgi:hypothetical protein